MAITPDTTVILLKVPIEIDELNQLTFSNATAQYNYFYGLPKLKEEDLYYQRKDNFIAFPAHIDSIIEYNYVMYQNSNYSNKWFYAFITNMEYENDGMTRVYIETDTFQTWQFDITYKACFVEREHVNDDTIGKHTISEDLNIGEVIQESKEDILMGTPDDPQLDPEQDLFYFACDCTYNPITEEDFKGSEEITGNLFGNWVFIFDPSSIGITYLVNFMEDLDRHDKINSLLNLYSLPKKLVDDITTVELHKGSTFGDYYLYKLKTSKTAVTGTHNITKTTSFTNLSIKNNKCFCFPYNYLYVSNNIGNDIIYKYEDFSDSTANFEVQMALSIGASVRLVPKNYKGVSYNYTESIPLAKYPTASWAGDAYTNWLTGNAVNVATSFVSTGTGAITAGTAGNYVGAASSFINGIGNLIGQFYEASLLPSITGGNNTGDVNFSNKDNKFSVYHMRAKTEYMQCIDNYFSMFGYKVNEVKVPNITGRTYWNFVKTVECNIEGNIPQQDLQKIKDMFNRGVTLWHDATKFLDYTQNNTIVTP